MMLNMALVVDNRYAALCRKLTLEVPTTTAADDIHNIFSLFFRENKT